MTQMMMIINDLRRKKIKHLHIHIDEVSIIGIVMMKGITQKSENYYKNNIKYVKMMIMT